MPTPTVLIAIDGAIATVTLNRPESRNALNEETLVAVADAFVALDLDGTVRVVVLDGAGPSFCAGADRKGPPGAGMAVTADSTDRSRRRASRVGQRAGEAIAACGAVTIARLHGHVIGGGVVLAAACDFRLASSDASFWLPEVDLGLPLTWGAIPRLAAEIGLARTREFVLMAERVTAETAASWGLAHRVVADHPTLDAEVERWATRLAAMPELAVGLSKEQFHAYATRFAQGDVSRFDGELLAQASRAPAARDSWG